MIPAEFDYRRVSSVDEAIAAIGEGGEDAKLLAGGHSLVPLMKLRLAAPTQLVDIGGIAELRGIARENGSWRIGPLTTHATLQSSDKLGAIAAVASKIADQQVRNRGTIGGSIAHADPASDLPAVLLALDATVTAQGPGGERAIAVADLWQDYLTTSLAPDEVITAIHVPASDDFAWGYEKFTRRAEDWAMAGVVALVKASGGACEDVRIGLTHMASTALRATAAEEALRGQPLDAEHIAAAAQLAAEGTEPPGDLNATAEYKQHLTRVLTRRALTQAAGG
jgi:carbon-monoxide dehydrogenase medium subunit